MPVTINDYFAKASSGVIPLATTLSSQKASGASSMSLSAATGWPTDTPIHCLLYTLMADGKTVTPGSVTVWKGILSGTTVGTLTLKGGTDATYASGSQVALAPTDSWVDDLITGILVSHNQDGTMIANLPLTTPKITTAIKDASGNEVIRTPATASAVNDVTVTNAATGGAPAVAASGDDSNVDLYLQGKGTGSARFAGLHDGWAAIIETLTYASATTFTCSAALAATFQVGDKIKLTQTTVKYFYVVGISGTTITVTGGTDYTLANAAITLPFYSKEVSPVGFPHWFSYTPTYAGFSANPTSDKTTFKIVGRSCTIAHYEGGDGTSNATSFTISLPVTAATLSGMNWMVACAVANSGLFGVGLATVASAASVLSFAKDSSNNVFTNSGAKRCLGVEITYQI